MSTLTGGSFLLKHADTADIFIPEEFTEEQLMILQMVKDFMLKEVHGLGIGRVASLDAEKDKDLVMEIFQKGLLTFQRVRTGGEQTIKVYYVNVSEGGQAILGNVKTGGKRK